MRKALLNTLLRTREHRENQAMLAVSECRKLLRSRLQDLRAVHSHLAVIRREQARLAGQLANGPAFEMADLACIDNRRALLRDRRSLVLKDLERVRSSVRKARETLSESVQTYRRARARRESAISLRDRWIRRENQVLERQAESASDDHILSRYLSTERA